MPVTPSLPGYPSLLRGYRSRALLHFRAQDGSIDAVSGQAGTFTRTGTATGADSAGNTITYRDHQPAWTMIAGKAALQCSAAAGVVWPFPRSGKPGALTAYLSLRHAGFGYTAGAGGVIALTTAAIANPRWTILGDAAANSGALTTLHHNGTSSVSSTLASGVTDGTDCEYLITLSAAGVIQVTRLTAAGVQTVATASGSLTVNAFVGDQLRCYAPISLYVLKLAAGARPIDEMRELS